MLTRHGRARTATILGIILAVAPPLGTAVAQADEDGALEQQAQLIPADTAYDGYGEAVAIDGTTALVGAPIEADGSAYVFDLEDGEWTQTVKLTPEDVDAPDTPNRFGSAVALAGDTALVGAHRADVDGETNAGAVYAFTEAGDGSWEHTGRLVPDDPQASASFGSALAFDGETAIVGASNRDTPEGDGTGAAYAFELSEGKWSSPISLTAPSLNAQASLGHSVAVDEDTALVSAPNFDGGAVYAFQSDAGWSHTQTLVPSDHEEADLFGFSVGLDGDTAVVGDLFAEAGAPYLRTPAAYFFANDDGTWTQTDKVEEVTEVGTGQFATTVAVDDGVAVIGASTGDVDQSGEVFVYTPSEDGWTQTARIDVLETHPLAGLGAALGIDGDTVIVGAQGQSTQAGTFVGSAYVFTACDEDGPASGIVHEEVEPAIGAASATAEDAVHEENCRYAAHAENSVST